MNKFQSTNIRRSSIVAVCMLGIFTGCASLTDKSSGAKGKKKEGWSWFKKKEYQEPKSLVAIWTEDTFAQPGKPMTRGFGGRLYFYNEKSQAIPVDGELIVYGYEEDPAKPSNGTWPSEAELAATSKKFGFTPEQFTQHFAESELGASYSVWIPWDAAGSDQKKITLCPMFISKTQRTTRGEIAKLNLSGKKADSLASNKANPSLLDSIPNNTIQLASASIPTVDAGALPKLSASPLQQRSDAPFNSQMRTTTIRLNQPINSGLVANNGKPALAENPQALQLLQSLQSQAQVNAATNMGPGTPSPVTSIVPSAGLATSNSLIESPFKAMAKEAGSAQMPSASAVTSWATSMQPMGQSLSANGWVKPGQAPMSTPSPLDGFQPNQSQAQGSATGR
jgi:hypothetical protein